VVIIFVVVIAATIAILDERLGSLSEIVMPMATGFGAMLVLFGPRMVRHDLRNDLAHLELLRSYPLSGRATFVGEVAGSTAVLTVLQVGFALLALALQRAIEGELPPARALAGGAVMLVVAVPAFTAAHVAIHNLSAVLFPDWVRTDRERMGGIEATGQGMIVLVFSLAALLLLMIVPLVLALVAVIATLGDVGALVSTPRLVTRHLLAAGVLPWLAASFTFAISLLGETLLLAMWGGRVLDRTEPNDVR